MKKHPAVGDLVRLTWDRNHLRCFFYERCPNLVNRNPKHSINIDTNTPYLVVRATSTLVGHYLGVVTPHRGIGWTSAEWMEVI